MCLTCRERQVTLHTWQWSPPVCLSAVLSVCPNSRLSLLCWMVTFRDATLCSWHTHTHTHKYYYIHVHKRGHKLRWHDISSPQLLCSPHCALLPPAGLEEEVWKKDPLLTHTHTHTQSMSLIFVGSKVSTNSAGSDTFEEKESNSAALKWLWSISSCESVSFCKTLKLLPHMNSSSLTSESNDMHVTFSTHTENNTSLFLFHIEWKYLSVWSAHTSCAAALISWLTTWPWDSLSIGQSCGLLSSVNSKEKHVCSFWQ